MAVVYLARERHPSRQVAIKVLDPVVTVGIGRERFLREIDFVSNLTHPHIVPIFAAGDAGGLLYFVMPYVAGESLADRIRRERRVDVVTALRFAIEIGQALEYAHRRDIVHRDIKPENILLHDEFALVADFGVARAFRAARSEVITQDGFTLGTPAYMSPEQAAGAPDVDPRSDIYALGCVLYHMLAGEPPFGHGPWDRVIQQQVREAPVSLRTRVPGIPRDVSVVVEHALAKKPADRFTSAGEFAGALAEVRAILTSGERASLRRGRPLARSRRWIGLAAGAAILLAGALLLRPGQPSVPPLAAAAPVYADSLAIMPIENLTPEPELDNVADAVTYQLITSLHRVPELKLPAYASVRRMAAESLGPREISERLGVRLVLSSQVRLVGGETRLSAELVDGRTDHVVESGSWAVPPDTRGLDADLVRQLVEIVRRGTGVTPGADRVTGLEGPAFETYRLGKYWMGRRTPSGIRRAIRYFRDAIMLDSTYAPAYEGLSSAYMLALFYRYEIGLDGYRVAALALAAAERAIHDDPRYGPGYGARGYVVSRAYGPLDRAAQDFGRALELSPNDPQALAWSGAVDAWRGDQAQALRATIQGTALDPLSPAKQLALALSMLSAQEYDRAATAAHRATELEPELVESRAVEGRALLLAGRLDACLGIDFGPHGAIRALCLHAVGRRAEAEAVIDSIARAVETGTLDDTAYTEVVRADGLASYYAWTGDLSRALRWLAFAFARSPIGVDRRVLDSPIFDRIRADPAARARLDRVIAGIWPRVERQAPEAGLAVGPRHPSGQ